MRGHIGVIVLRATLLLSIIPAANATEPPSTPDTRQTVNLNRPLRDASMTVQHVVLQEPVEFVDGDRKKKATEILEFRVSSSDVIPARALDPVLYVGKTRVTEYHFEDDGRTLVFSLFDQGKAKDGALSYLQFGDERSTRTPLPKLVRKHMKEVRR
jgi:hypothetical protein